MPKEGGNPAGGRRPSSRNAKPYDANNSFVRKVATKVTDFIPQSSWISKWFNTSQGNEDALEGRGSVEETELEDDTQQPPPAKRSRIRMDVIHPPGTFSIQTRVKTALNAVDPSKEQYPVHNEMTEDFLEPATAGPSGMGRLISSTPAVQADIRTVTSHRSDLNSLVSTNNGIANGMDDNSESSESTSGCSSLIPQINRHEGPSNLSYNSTFTNRKRHEDKLTFTNHLQSPRSLFLDSNSRDTLSSRRPSFNASIVTNAVDRASPLSSPFYSGNITFGGANAAGLYKRSRNIFNNSNEVQLKVPRRTNVEVKPSDTGVDSSGMSQTAKKILEALEHFSSPISDAKKIPLKNTNNAASSAMSRKRAREEKIASPSARIGLRHLTRELTVPTVPDILKLRRRQKLQDTTLVARKIVSARSDPPPSQQDYQLRTEDSKKYRGKLKGKSKINLEQEKTVAPVNLPNIPLPITTLPNFNFTLPPPALYSAGTPVANKKDTFTFASPIKVTDAGKSLHSVNNFTFSNPINAEDCASNTTDPNSPSTTENEFTIDRAVASGPNFIWSGSSTAPRLKAKVKSRKDSVGSPVVQELKPENIMDLLLLKAFQAESNSIRQSNPGLASETSHTDKVASTFVSSDSDTTSTRGGESSWECSECMIRNSDTDKQCTACKISRANPNEKASLPSTSTTDTTVVKAKPVAHDCFGSQFKLSTNQWECTACCVRNKQSDATCVACTTPKPGSGSTMQQTVKSQNFNLMEKFKPAEGSWECSGCLLRNTANVITCPCCNASKPMTSVKAKPKTDNVTGSSSTKDVATQEISSNSEMMNKFKPSKDSWECPGCLVRNNSSVATCPCCSTPKPNSIGGPNRTEPKSSNGFGDKFKKPEGSWTCDSCLLQNDAKHTECVACQALKPGAVKVNESSSNTGSTLQFKFGVPSGTTNLTSQPGGFKFGLDKADEQSKSDASPLNGFKFGNAQQNSGTAQFTFGIPKEENKAGSDASKTNNVTTSSSSTGFLFNVKSPEKSESTSQNQETKQKTLFGMPKSDGLTTASEKQNTSVVSSAPSTAPSFTFGVQKAEFNQPASSKEAPKTSFAIAATESSQPAAATDAVPINTNTTLPSLLAPKDTTKNTNAKSDPIFSFGVSSASATTTSTNATTTCLPTFAQTFKFSDSKTSSQLATVPSFGQAPISSTASVLSTSVSFGGNKATETTASTKAANDTPVAPLFPIVSSSTPLFTESKTTIAFGTGKPSSFATTDSKPSGFAMPENKISTFGGNAESKPPIFGTSETKLPVFNSPPAVASGLSTFDAASGGTAASLPFGSSNAPAFGGNTTSAFGGATTTPTIFSNTKPSEATASSSSLFTFGSSSSQQPASGGFNFTANVNPAAPSSAKPLFTFGGNSSTSQSNNSTFGSGTFGANAAPTNTANFTFNPPKQETPAAFGQGAVTTPIFGTPQTNPQTQATSSFSSTASSSTGFNFGPTAPVAATSGGFNFGGMSSTSAPAGGFNFNPASTPAVAFDPNSRPSFNFTKGSAPAIFNAPPQSAPAPRKIKKAFRRCAR
ncbi:PREDICTED: nuclear pore complex protein Nup153 [Vollenhovia emeryi]|uniref:nuclear pore complex protein Nup153 n=1 Tax=Vollenhovia emeryi TaxID=411798 RepID=UPI0005F424FC|nr:PREDICTED: nuclear pore complex protein Nup153 [Vollenhovia emeryi]